MPPLDLSFFAIAGPAVMFAGISKGGFGSGAAFASAAILALVMEPGAAIGIMLPLLMLIDLATLKPYWKRWNTHDALVLILGSLPGVVLGAAFYTVADADHLRLLIGGIALLFVLWQIAGRAGKIPVAGRPFPLWGGLVAGLAAGFTSFVAHAGGPAAAVYLLSKRPGKTEFQATTVIVFWVNNILKAAPYGMLGIFTAETLWADLWLAPFALIGTWLGVRAHFAIPERLFFAVTYVLLTVTGAKLVWDGLS
ncbi:sulfite exporter TauE/SafE family protein [Aquicoccus porphyridii]|uniref:Probable membrane transporter protein n=1 Tax=Aquicoccus porphyridii TaxID=1852029 RepID=A0A5A9Z5I8_9RHOB|nr:sulfite exporter TauE/SafE family protein [Aquicoccus porphyridii]KAA0912456.1 sulfite exporter TauE/SafE family protein [Aquicoccus porphyridii]RAI53136.1 sulfite exporter TauE/SafE family protein [Rhodobacteraceae bacterium AsT-22]